MEALNNAWCSSWRPLTNLTLTFRAHHLCTFNVAATFFQDHPYIWGTTMIDLSRNIWTPEIYEPPHPNISNISKYLDPLWNIWTVCVVSVVHVWLIVQRREGRGLFILGMILYSERFHKKETCWWKNGLSVDWSIQDHRHSRKRPVQAQGCSGWQGEMWMC